jgi:excisionase family DNA binding protein
MDRRNAWQYGDDVIHNDEKAADAATPAKKRTPKVAVKTRVKLRVEKPDYFTASDVASVANVDLKTIHNWVNKGKLPHFRTPGRHLRFRPREVVPVLRGMGFTIPVEVEARRAADAKANANKDHRVRVPVVSEP